MGIEEAFARHTTYKEKDGRHTFDCRPFFSVDAPTKQQAETEARHYFWQYYQDGEFDQ